MFKSYQETGNHNILIPLTQPLQFTRPIGRWGNPITIDPYLLGLLLGDGSFRYSPIRFTTADQELLDYVQLHAEVSQYGDIEYALKNDELSIAVHELGLDNLKSKDKFVPEAYKYASIEIRLAILQGLLDTDGYIDKRGHCVFTSVSKQLAQDVQFICHSLGAKATLTSKQGGYRHAETGEFIECLMAYNVYIQSGNNGEFFRLSRKQGRGKPFNGGHSPIGRRIVNIEYIGKEKAQCIKVDHPNGLYLTDDFIVTHNTDLILGCAGTIFKNSLILRREFPQLDGIIDRGNEIFPVEFTAGLKSHWRFSGRTIKLGSIPHPKNWTKYQGRGRDLIACDEAAELPDAILNITGWNRTVDSNQNTLVLLCFNPPMTPDGEWIIHYFGPWLDEDYPNPAEPGKFVILPQ
jgi:hypothetical protein